MRFSDYNSLFTPRIIGIFALFIMGAIAFGIVIVRGSNAWNGYCTGWKALTQRFPPTDAHKFGERYKRQTVFFGSGTRTATGGFLIELAQEGFLVTANFARTPILIPWPDIREVDTGFLGMTVIASVDYDKRVRFHLLKDALAGLQQNVPAERFREPTSLLNMIKNHPHNPPR